MPREFVVHNVFECDYYFHEQNTTLEMTDVRMLDNFGIIKKDEEFDSVLIEYPTEEIICFSNKEIKYRFKIKIIPA